MWVVVLIGRHQRSLLSCIPKEFTHVQRRLHVSVGQPPTREAFRRSQGSLQRGARAGSISSCRSAEFELGGLCGHTATMLGSAMEVAVFIHRAIVPDPDEELKLR